MEITGVILAGGNSSRMGTDKAFVEVKGKPMIDYAIEALAPICNKVVISANKFPAYKNLEIWPDEFPINAPMIGIYSCLKRTQTQLCFVLSCDMPLINKHFVEFLISRHQTAFDFTIPCHNKNKTEPLCAVYSKSILEKLETFISEQNFKLQNLVEKTNANIISLETEYDAYLPKMFANINSLKDIDSLGKN